MDEQAWTLQSWASAAQKDGNTERLELKSWTIYRDE